MTWTYSGDPSNSNLDAARYWCGDTDSDKQKVSDEEIDFLLTEYGTSKLAAAGALRALASQAARKVTSSVDGVSYNWSNLAQQYRDQAAELDPQGVTETSVSSATIVIGGVKVSEKAALDSATDLTQPFFKRESGDVPEGW
jgi:hypothetical protein